MFVFCNIHKIIVMENQFLRLQNGKCYLCFDSCYKYVLVVEICHTRHLWRCEDITYRHQRQNIHVGELGFGIKITSMGSRRNMTFAYSMAYDIANIMWGEMFKYYLHIVH